MEINKDPEVQRIADELFAEIQGPQGIAFVSDGEVADSVGDFIDLIELKLQQERIAVRIMVNFIKKYRRAALSKGESHDDN